MNHPVYQEHDGGKESAEGERGSKDLGHLLETPGDAEEKRANKGGHARSEAANGDAANNQCATTERANNASDRCTETPDEAE